MTQPTLTAATLARIATARKETGSHPVALARAATLVEFGLVAAEEPRGPYVDGAGDVYWLALGQAAGV